MQLLVGDCREKLKELPDNSVDSIVTDPPYELGFMGKSWDSTGIAYDSIVWSECMRVLKPGGYLLAFGGSRTYHRLACAVEDAGFEIRDQIQWIYGTGFPKSLDVSKALDKAAGAERKIIGFDEDYARRNVNGKYGLSISGNDNKQIRASVKPITAATTDAAKKWDGWGTALKPAHEPIVLARKPLIGTVVENVLQHGTGGLNIDGCRIDGQVPSVPQPAGGTGDIYGFKNGLGRSGEMSQPHTLGRWPANVIHDGSDEVLLAFPDDTQRFFYCAKASKKDRNEGLDEFESKSAGECTDRKDGSDGLNSPRAGAGRTSGSKNHHPTVKPTDLMKYLVRLVTPVGGIVLDPFMGSGSTGKAAALEGFDFIGIELSEDYLAIAKARIDSVKNAA